MRISEDSFPFPGNNVPYGRSRWFVAGNEKFNNNDIDTLEYYAFSPVPEKKVYSRIYAREKIVEYAIETVIKERADTRN